MGFVRSKYYFKHSKMSLRQINNSTYSSNIISPFLNFTLSYENLTYGNLTQRNLRSEVIPRIDSFNIDYKVVSVVIILSAIIYISYVSLISQSYKSPIYNILRTNKENQQVLPRYHPIKAKDSPFMTAEIPKLLPTCPRLDGAEKGQNILFKLSVPYRRHPSLTSLATDDDHHITITTVVEGNRSQSPTPTI